MAASVDIRLLLTSDEAPAVTTELGVEAGDEADGGLPELLLPLLDPELDPLVGPLPELEPLPEPTVVVVVAVTRVVVGDVLPAFLVETRTVVSTSENALPGP